MMTVPVQVPSLILPYPYVNPTSTEIVADIVTHVSTDIWPLEQMRDKTAIIWAAEVCPMGGVPGALNCWIELSPFPSSTSTAFWAAIGGGGGVLPPVAPQVEAALGVHGTVHTFGLAWDDHSPYARIVVQTPVAVALPLAYWVVQVWFMASGG